MRRYLREHVRVCACVCVCECLCVCVRGLVLASVYVMYMSAHIIQ
jgi:hypothetical protein